MIVINNVDDQVAFIHVICELRLQVIGGTQSIMAAPSIIIKGVAILRYGIAFGGLFNIPASTHLHRMNGIEDV